MIECLEEGTRLRDRYVIEKVLGKGGFGITYKAMDSLVDVPVAIKQYDIDKMTDGEEALNEAKMAAGFYELEGIASARDYFTENDICFIVMEYVHGTSIKKYISEYGRMNGKEVLEKMFPIFRSVSKIHARGVIHRDISADNLMITPEGKLMLIDFGAARSTKEYDEKTYTLIFKRGFAPIEQCRAKSKQGAWTDIYSLCATIYYMITGMVPDDAVERMIDDKLKPLSKMQGTGLTSEQSQVIMKGLAVLADKRYQNVEALVNDLYDVSESSSTVTEMQTQKTSVSVQQGESTTQIMKQIEIFDDKKKHKKKRKRWIKVIVGVLTLGVVGLVSILWFNNQSKKSISRIAIPSTARPAVHSTAHPTVRSTMVPTLTPVQSSKPISTPITYTIANYVSMTQKRAEKKLAYLEKIGFHIKIIKKYNNKVEAGNVYEQKPEAGKEYHNSDNVTVTLYVSKGKKPEANTPKSSNQSSIENNKKDVSFDGNLDDILK